MKKVIRLTESDLVRLVKKIIKEQEGGDDFDHFNKLVKPQMTSNGFKYNYEPPVGSQPPYGTGYFAYPNHNNGVNLFLDTTSGNWKYVVYRVQNGQDKDLKNFEWKVGTNAEVKKAAQDAVNYAVQLKNTYYK